MEDDAELAAFQAALMELLAEQLPPEEALAQMRARPAFAPFREYVETFDARAVVVATELVQRWGRRLDGG